MHSGQTFLNHLPDSSGQSIDLRPLEIRNAKPCSLEFREVANILFKLIPRKTTEEFNLSVGIVC